MNEKYYITDQAFFYKLNIKPIWKFLISFFKHNYVDELIIAKPKFEYEFKLTKSIYKLSDFDNAKPFKVTISQKPFMASTENIAYELESLGYTMSDILTLYLGRMNPAGERTNATFVEKLSEDFNKIINKQDYEKETEHYERVDMMEEDSRRHNRRVLSALERDDCIINLATLFDENIM